MKPKRSALGKITRPRLAGILPRERLFRVLEEGGESPAVWISGPPGSGKTTLAASYLDHAGVPALWYQLDEGDGDAATFFYYLRLAAEERDAAGAEPLPVLGPEYHAGLQTFARRYFQSLYARLRPPFAIVFDGYQDVPADSALHEVMRVALGELPPGGRVIVVSRADPPPVLARLRANRILRVVDGDALRLTREETGRIALGRRPGLDEASLDALHARTQGWAAGLVLALEQAKFGDGAALAGPGVAPLVFDYLAGEILQKTDAATQDFLLRTACLPQMTPGLAAELSGEPRAGEILAGLHRDNYFVTLREAQPEPLYQYHPMLRDFLLARAGETLSKDQRRDLLRRAARLLEAAGRPEDALSLYREGHDWIEMVRLIELQAESLLAQGRGETVRQWTEELPPEVLDRSPWAVYWSAASQAQIAPREARLLYEKAYDLFCAEEASGMAGMTLACSGAMDAILYELDDLSLLDRWIVVLDEAARHGARFPSPAAEARIACSMVFSLTLRQPHRPDIEQWISRALGAARHAADPNLQMFVGLLCALTLMWTGLYERALELVEAARRLAGAPGVTPFSRITLKNIEAMHAMLGADGPACQAAVREGLDIARATGVNTWTFQLLLYGYGGALGAGDLAGAAARAKQLEAHLEGAGRFNLCVYRHFRAWEAMIAREPMQALQHEKAALRLAVEVGCPYFEALCRLALAQVLFECGDRHKCIAQLQRTRTIVRQIPNRHLEFTGLLCFADMALQGGRVRPGLKALRQGLEVGREYGYRHFLWWWPAAMSRVCAKALDAGIEAEYTRTLIRGRRLVAPAGAGGDAWPWMFRVQALGGFRLLRHDEPLGGTGKAQLRPLDLLKILVAFGGEQVSEARITDALWPRIDGDSAHRSFTSALHRLRKLLGEDRAVVLHEGKLTLDRRYVWVDAWALEALVVEMERAGPEALEALGERLLALYRGPFLGDEPGEAWALAPRERIRSRFARAMGRLARHWTESGETARARDWLARCAEADPAAAQQDSFKSSVTQR